VVQPSGVRAKPDVDVTGAIERFCALCRQPVLAELRHILDAHRWHHAELDELVLEYPLRPAKGLRPALCIATARALGACEDAVLTTAAVIELLHNAFLIHDDVEDESLFRRGEPTLQRSHGLPVAVNVADAMFAISLLALLDNLELLGLRISLEIFQNVAEMLWTTAGGQALELGWIRDNTWQLADYRAAYEDMVVRKTATYSFIVPVRIAGIAAAASPEVRGPLDAFARHVGIAFQIADDLLNLRDDTDGYGKEALGDLWEGKRTLMLLHAMNTSPDPAAVRNAAAILALPRPSPEADRDPLRAPEPPEALDALRRTLDELHAAGRVDETARATICAAIARACRPRAGREVKTAADVRALSEMIERSGGGAYARDVALDHVTAAERALADCGTALAAGEARDFLAALPAYVLERLR
jgi:geranylgeranyl diphosphate synthase type II